MNKFSLKFTGFIFAFLFFTFIANTGYSYSEFQEGKEMFTTQTAQPSSNPKNLKGINFSERESRNRKYRG